MNDLAPSGVTYPETAWLVNAVPVMFTIAVILILTLLLRGSLLRTLHMLLARYLARGREKPIGDALQFVPPIVTGTELLRLSTLSAIGILLVLQLIGPLFMAVVLTGPATSLVIAGLLSLAEARYRNQLDEALPEAVNRLAAQLAAGNGFQQALEGVTSDLPHGPLRTEWLWILDRLGTPLSGGRLATVTDVVAALVVQTPSKRHHALLSHLEVALDQTHDVLLKRVLAAGEALHAAARRKSAAVTELAQMKYSGIAVGLAGVVMALYLLLTQWERMAVAYRGDIGLIVGGVVLLALLAPLIGGVLLARIEDVDY